MAKKLESLLGAHILRQAGDSLEQVPVGSLCGAGRVVGLYFSAHWCPPCRNFTPLLIDFYKNRKKCGDNLEIVFVSWDKDEASFKEYFSSMPWTAVPFDPKKKAKLTKKYRVQGIPKLVLIDGDTGKLITCEGYSCVINDKDGQEFPWRPKKVQEVIQGKLLRSDRTEVDAMESLKGKTVCLYFSAHWCPPCRAFTPMLAKLYKKLTEDKKNVEVVFVSSDRSEESFGQYLDTMPWLAVPFGDPRIDQIKNLFAVDGIPMLVVLDDKGDVITLNGRGAAMLDEEGLEFPWHPKPVNELTGNAAIQLNESACLVLFTEGEDEDIEWATEVLTEAATVEHNKHEDQELFFFFGGDDEICDSVRNFAKLPDTCPLLVILDFPEQKVYKCAEKTITSEVVKDFVRGYLGETLEPLLLRGPE